MEWTGQQQIEFLLLSFLLGVVQGMVLDIVTNCFGISRRKKWLLSDVLFGPIAAVITFCGALVIMDGQLHPILVGGVFLGMAVEHILIGTSIGKLFGNLRTVIRKTIRSLRDKWAFFHSYSRDTCAEQQNDHFKGEKRRKYPDFFKKTLEIFTKVK